MFLNSTCMWRKHCLRYLSSFCSVVSFEASRDRLMGEDTIKDRSMGTMSRTLLFDGSVGLKTSEWVDTSRWDACCARRRLPGSPGT